MKFPPQQLDLALPSLDFPDDRCVLTVGEVAKKLRISDRHVIDLIEEGKLVAVDIAGRAEYVRVPMTFVNTIATLLGRTPAEVLGIIAAAKPQRGGNRAHYRVPVVEGFDAFLKENHTLAGPGI